VSLKKAVIITNILHSLLGLTINILSLMWDEPESEPLWH